MRGLLKKKKTKFSHFKRLYCIEMAQILARKPVNGPLCRPSEIQT